MALQRRDYAALRSLTGVAPVTKKSGKSCIVIRRQACSNRLANVMYHWARVAIQLDTTSKAKYATLRGRGHSHGRALRSVADRLLDVACAMLKNGTLFNPSLKAQNDRLLNGGESFPQRSGRTKGQGRWRVYFWAKP